MSRLIIYFGVFGGVGAAVWALLPYLNSDPLTLTSTVIYGGMIATVPMALAGVLAALFANRVAGVWERVLFGALTASLALPLWRTLIYKVSIFEHAPWLDLTLLAWSVNGVIAALCCGLLLQWIERRFLGISASESPPAPRTPSAPPSVR